jgi:hypothetical protein
LDEQSAQIFAMIDEIAEGCERSAERRCARSAKSPGCSAFSTPTRILSCRSIRMRETLIFATSTGTSPPQPEKIGVK